jgi:P27 family predicted phage terminase small subunit
MTARKSDEIKKLAGTFRPQRALPPDFVALLSELPPAPKSLSDEAKNQWLALAPAVLAVGISQADFAAYALLCETLASAELARREIERDGMMIAAGKVGHKSHPAIGVMEHARVQAANLLDRFHLTPKSRIGTAPPKTPRSTFGKDGRATVREGDTATADFWNRFGLPENVP